MIDDTAPVFPGGNSPQAAQESGIWREYTVARESKEIRALG